MARSKINSRSKDLMADNGAVLVSVVEGEQIHMDITLNWITNLTGYTLTAKIVEANMAGAVNGDGYPTEVKSGGVVTTLTIVDADVTDNTFKIVIPEGLVDSWVTQPAPDTPSYGWIGLEVRDSGIGDAQQIWKPFRGLVEVMFSPSEEV
ncbi:hypothetical protein OAD54_01420 [Candidatus Pelagibacter sp.]|nr:hypothetical protein [Candidatus Pelagibacter sp.]